MHSTSPRLGSSVWTRLLLLTCVALATICVSSAAWAFGRVEWKSKTFEERTSTKSWHLELAIYLPQPPDMAHMPMKFEFEPVAYYDRSIIDGDKIVEQRIPLQHKQPLIESVDVGFMDPGSGQIQSRTRFSFRVTRAHGYEAGEYKVTIRDSRNDRTIGTPTTLTFKGENELIDRRSIVFTGKKKAKENESEKKAEESSDDDTAAEEPAERDTAGDVEDSESDEEDEGAVPPSIEEKPGACGCHHGPSHGEPLLWLVPSAILLGLWMRRREAHG